MGVGQRASPTQGHLAGLVAAPHTNTLACHVLSCVGACVCVHICAVTPLCYLTTWYQLWAISLLQGPLLFIQGHVTSYSVVSRF